MNNRDVDFQEFTAWTTPKLAECGLYAKGLSSYTLVDSIEVAIYIVHRFCYTADRTNILEGVNFFQLESIHKAKSAIASFNISPKRLIQKCVRQWVLVSLPITATTRNGSRIYGIRQNR